MCELVPVIVGKKENYMESQVFMHPFVLTV